jgi:hypothetical protein
MKSSATSTNQESFQIRDDNCQEARNEETTLHGEASNSLDS